MLKQIVIFFALICTVTLVSGKITAALADWRGPTVIPQMPQQTLPQPQQPKLLPDGFLQPTLKNIPSAPQAVTGHSQGNSGARNGHDNSRDGQMKYDAHPEHDPVKETVLPPVYQPSVSEAQHQAPADVEKPAFPASKPSNTKTPWLLAAGVVVVAFLFGRRSR
jgi:hypothetical protein